MVKQRICDAWATHTSAISTILDPRFTAGATAQTYNRYEIIAENGLTTPRNHEERIALVSVNLNQ